MKFLFSGILLKGQTRDVIGVVQSVKPEKRRDDDKLSVTLGRVISGLAGVSADNKDMKRLMKSYQKSATMSELIKIYIQKIISSENFEKELAHFFEKFTKQIDAVGKLIPKFLSADREMLKSLTKQKSANENRLAETPALIAACSKLQGHLGMFYVNKIKVFDITLPNFESDVPFGTGSFANVYLSQLSVDGKMEKVALKVWRERLTTTNITDILLEDSILR